jgi:hypothetical protein
MCGLRCDACVRRCHTVSKETPARPSSPANDTLLPNGHKLEHFFLIFYIIPLFYLLTEPSKRKCPHLVGRAGGMACRCYCHRCSCCCFLSVLCYFCSATFDFPLPVKMDGWMVTYFTTAGLFRLGLLLSFFTHARTLGLPLFCRSSFVWSSSVGLGGAGLWEPSLLEGRKKEHEVDTTTHALLLSFSSSHFLPPHFVKM